MAAKATTAKASPSKPTAAAKKPSPAAKLSAGKAPAAKTAGKPAAKSPPPAKAAQITVTLKQLSAEIGEKHALAKKQADTMLADVFGCVVDHLKSGARVRIGGLGIIEVKNRPARMGRNPATGAAIEIKASKKVAFRAAKELKEAI